MPGTLWSEAGGGEASDLGTAWGKMATSVMWCPPAWSPGLQGKVGMSLEIGQGPQDRTRGCSPDLCKGWRRMACPVGKEAHSWPEGTMGGCPARKGKGLHLPAGGRGWGLGAAPPHPPFPSCPLAALLYMRLQLKRLRDLHLTPPPGQGNKETVCLSADSRAPHAGDGWPGRFKACRRSPEEGEGIPLHQG